MYIPVVQDRVANLFGFGVNVQSRILFVCELAKLVLISRLSPRRRFGLLLQLPVPDVLLPAPPSARERLRGVFSREESTRGKVDKLRQELDGKQADGDDGVEDGLPLTALLAFPAERKVAHGDGALLGLGDALSFVPGR